MFTSRDLALAIGTHVPLDHVFVVVLALLWPAIDYFWLYPRLTRATAAGVPGARARTYLLGMLHQWGLVAWMLALWAAHGRSWEGLGLGPGSPLRLGLGLALAAVLIGLLWLQRRALLARPERFDLVLRQVGAAAPLLPHTPGENRSFKLLSVTAGICEELLYRGYLLWYLSVWTGPVAAAAISTLLFGAAHLYLDRRSAVKAGLVGGVMALIVYLSGSLWPAMIIHAAVDMNSGGLAFLALNRARAGNPDPGLPAAATAA